MAQVTELMAHGIAAAPANNLGQTAVSTIAAAGASAGAATAIVSSFTVVSTTPSNAGVILKQARGQPETVVYNGGANTLKIYPATSEKINNQTASTGTLSVPTAKSAILIASGNQWIGIVSA